MKGLLLGIILFLTACGCGERDNSKVQYKYGLGDVVLIKPDSLKATINSRYFYGVGDNGDNGIRYEIIYFDNDGDQRSDYVKEFQIYKKTY